MKPGLLIFALVASMTSALLSQASAAPPTVTPSPGYDARLQEERAARSRTALPSATSGTTAPVVGRHVKKPHHVAR
jgi:hypothetical protein